jgi:hypothetical protein
MLIGYAGGIRRIARNRQFENDRSPVSTIVKGIKRAIAGEYGREFSAKGVQRQSRLTELGFRPGGPAGYGWSFCALQLAECTIASLTASDALPDAFMNPRFRPRSRRRSDGSRQAEALPRRWHSQGNDRPPPPSPAGGTAGRLGASAIGSRSPERKSPAGKGGAWDVWLRESCPPDLDFARI